MKNKKHTTPDKEVYSKEELAFFKTLESDIDNDTYQPMTKSQLEEEKEIAKKTTKDTIQKRTRKNL